MDGMAGVAERSDLVTQRLMKAVLDHKPAPYSDGELKAIATNCTVKEDAARKVERKMAKRLAAVALSHRLGETFRGVVTGVDAPVPDKPAQVMSEFLVPLGRQR